MAVIWYAAGLAAHKRFDEALEHLRRAEARDPFSRPLRNQLVRVLYMARRFDDARRECDQILKDEPSFRMSFCGLARVQSDAISEGIADLEVLVRSSHRAGNLSALGYAYGRAGRTADAIRVAGQIARQTEDAGCLAYYSAEVRAGLNDREGTLARLERARQLRCPTVMLRIQVDPKFDALTPDERARLATPLPAN